MRSVNYFGYTVFEDGTVISKRDKAPMKIQLNYKGYPAVGFQVNGKKLNKTIHRLLAELFIPNPDNLEEVDHIDGDRLNYSISNLRWVSHGENIKHSYNLKNRSAIGENNSRATITESIVREICDLLQKGLTSAQIRDLGFDYGRVRSIKRRQNWTHVSCEYAW